MTEETDFRMEHLIWDVDPDLIHIGPFRVRWYGLFFASGFLVGYAILTQIYRREGRPVENLSALFVYLLFGTIIGARLGHVLLYHPDYYLARPWEILMIWQGGLASHGGFTGVLIAIYLYLRKYRDMTFLQLADRLAIAALWTAGMIRIGNFFNSEILGTPSSAPWAIVFRRVDDIPRHPAMLYEAAAYLLVFCALYTAYWKTKIAEYPGRILGVTLATSFLARFLIEFVKENQAPFEEALVLNMGQLLSLPFIAAGILLIAFSRKAASVAAVNRKSRRRARP
jgi:prolipoprotein diacylglyceryl transferase